jgi:hypothetical protein
MMNPWMKTKKPTEEFMDSASIDSLDAHMVERVRGRYKLPRVLAGLLVRAEIELSNDWARRLMGLKRKP